MNFQQTNAAAELTLMTWRRIRNAAMLNLRDGKGEGERENRNFHELSIWTGTSSFFVWLQWWVYQVTAIVHNLHCLSMQSCTSWLFNISLWIMAHLYRWYIYIHRWFMMIYQIYLIKLVIFQFTTLTRGHPKSSCCMNIWRIIPLSSWQ